MRNSQTTALITWEKTFKYPYNQGIFIDIFPMDNIPDDEYERRVYFDGLTELNDRLGNGEIWCIPIIRKQVMG